MQYSDHLNKNQAISERQAACMLLNGWKNVTEDDRTVFDTWFSSFDLREGYENHWAYVTQESRKQAFYRIFNRTLILVFMKNILSDFVFVVLYSREDFDLKTVSDTAKGLRDLLAKRVIIRRASAYEVQQMGHLQGWVVPHTAYSCADDMPEDVFPQVIIDCSLDHAIASESKHQRRRNQIKRLKDRHDMTSESLRVSNLSQAEDVIATWTTAYNDRLLGKVADSAAFANEDSYLCLLKEFGARSVTDRDFGLILFLDSNPVAVSFAGKTGVSTAGLYMSICAKRLHGLTELLIVETCNQLKASGIDRLNLGGSETKELFHFKSRLSVVDNIQKFDFEIV